MREHDVAHRIATQGHAVIEGAVPEHLVETLADKMREQWRAHGAPKLFSQRDVSIGERVHVSPVGMAMYGILEPIPEAAHIALLPEVRGVVETLLGPRARLELAAGIVSDHTRPFFFWHHHVGGIDGEDVRGTYPPIDRIERIVCTTYLCPLDDAHGTMLVWPRRVGEPTAPPRPPGSEPWPGCVELRAPAGSIVFFDQPTWHAVTPMKREGLRAFIAFFVTRADAPASRRRDPTIPAALAGSAELARAYSAGVPERR
ncbi:hypothetical protein [Sandaracinus amylolyticus]|uniref:Prolyl 4-hydroxylase alpha subunit Fe(2+) 2OG dioxygenase domain-containing protein n=1 Tax=Sandaracinus amylolyticus TaxID=927083 RepID=A0A0F6VZ76_9BACT|nr:hypothetical protein [Sandaracinus amylolyticus]AKF03215.1 hypothetical protein DB32_000364 [Sandaracinus amylolyticus]